MIGAVVGQVGFIVTNLARPAERVVAFYGHRGTVDKAGSSERPDRKWFLPLVHGCARVKQAALRFRAARG